MALWPIVSHALLWGLVLSAALFALFLVILRWNPEIMLKDYPPDIQAKHGPMSERAKRQKWLASIAFIAVLVAIVAASFQKVRALDGGDLRFSTSFVHAWTMFSLFNLLDWLVLDVPLVALQPQFFVLPGTEGMAGYRDYWFHFRGFLIGIVASLASALLTAAIAAAFF
jgi:hypothetical protein